MIDEDHEIADDFDEIDEPSKSQLKRDAHAIRDLGADLAALGASERARIPLPDDIRDTIDDLNRIKSNGAKKRQLGLLAKRLRQIDLEPVEAAIEAIRQAARANTRTLHLIEQWRDRLLGDAPGESPKDALTAFLDRYPHADRQTLRQLQGNSLKERSNGKPPKSARLLFRHVRDAVNTTPDHDG